MELIEKAISISKNDPDKKLDALKNETEKLLSNDAINFDKIFDQKDADAYSWDLWAAAYTI